MRVERAAFVFNMQKRNEEAWLTENSAIEAFVSLNIFNKNKRRALSKPSDLCNLKTYVLIRDLYLWLLTNSLPRHATVIVITCIGRMIKKQGQVSEIVTEEWLYSLFVCKFWDSCGLFYQWCVLVRNDRDLLVIMPEYTLIERLVIKTFSKETFSQLLKWRPNCKTTRLEWCLLSLLCLQE